MKYCFIAVVHCLKLDKPDSLIPLASGKLSNKESLLEGILKYQSNLALDTLGVFSIDEFKGSSFYFVDGEFDASITEEKVNSIGTQLAFAFLRQIQSVSDNLWMIKDNAIYVRDGFLFVYDKVFDEGMTFKASLSTINTKASGKRGDVIFTKEEIEKAAKGMAVNSLEDVLSGSDYRNATQQQYFKGAKVGRKALAGYYIFHARAAAALPIKVLMYITAMEALISTSTSELSHQVAERVAAMLGKDITERILIYNEIKKGYGYRSKTAHGEALKGTEQDAMALLEHLDDYLRQLMTFDTPYNLDDEQINEWFLKRLLSNGKIEE